MSVRAVFPSEIHERIRRGYLDRLSRRVKRMRKLYAERDWQELRLECQHLRNSAASFGFPSLADMAARAEGSIPEGEVSRARVPSEARQAAEDLFGAIDGVLVSHNCDLNP